VAGEDLLSELCRQANRSLAFAPIDFIRIQTKEQDFDPRAFRAPEVECSVICRKTRGNFLDWSLMEKFRKILLLLQHL